jgi:hypothetical protein
MIALEAIYKAVTNAYADHHGIPRPFPEPFFDYSPEEIVARAEARADELADWRLEEAMRDERYDDGPDQDHIPCDPAPSDTWRNR